MDHLLLKGLGPVHWFLPENSQYSIQNNAVARKAVFLPKIIKYSGWFNVYGVSTVFQQSPIIIFYEHDSIIQCKQCSVAFDVDY